MMIEGYDFRLRGLLKLRKLLSFLRLIIDAISLSIFFGDECGIGFMLTSIPSISLDIDIFIFLQFTIFILDI